MEKAITTTQALTADSKRAIAPAILRVVGFAALIALGAQVRIPVPGSDVPMTLQLLAVLLAGYLLSWKEAVVCVGLYLAAGSAGLPVFTHQSLGVFGPTGGYLIGFLPAAALVALLKGMSLARMVFAGSAAIALVLGSGVAMRWMWFAGDEDLALATGLTPFWFKALVELGIAVTLVRAVRTGSNG